MKPIHLNLAARPYRDYRVLYAVVMAASVLIAFLMLNNIDTYYRYVRETETTRGDIRRYEQQIKKEREAAARVQAQIKAIDLATLGNQTRFINAQLAERAFSWSELLDRLEATLPRDVRIRSISPTFLDNGTVRLSMNCETKSPSGLVHTLEAFQRNPQFTKPFPSAESNTSIGSTFGLTVDYKPSIARAVVWR